MAPVVFAANLGVHTSRAEKKTKKDLLKIQGIVEVCVSLVTGRVLIIGMANAATLGELLAAKLGRPVFLLVDLGAAPAPPVGAGYGVMPPPPPAPPLGGGYGVMPPPSPAPPVGGGDGVMPPPPPTPSSAFTALAVGGVYLPYGYGVMPGPWLAPSSRLPAPPMGGYYNPYVRYNQLRYAAPPPTTRHYYTPFGRGGRPWEDEALADIFEDEHHNRCCCSIQ